ncbi:hypothetical protein G5B31_11340 [Rhodobacter sp. SGA-6-6]|uniref:hypothetical protein n=1 Tax=Rhodobacter sp. SGA-6-6 TaxID=2710882 RepID=UPI0013ED9D49|nr:hypothetical protein [Rhodobacter sp. SGA-6-6]NGM46127.1 hypothetical protein [Rhodobacter sp. SGA-6-6]
MSIEQTVAALEGRLLAHRKLLARLLAGSPEDSRAAIADWLAGQEVMPDGQEDPGAVPGEGLAVELALSDELRRISRLCEGVQGGSAAG